MQVLSSQFSFSEQEAVFLSRTRMFTKKKKDWTGKKKNPNLPKNPLEDTLHHIEWQAVATLTEEEENDLEHKIEQEMQAEVQKRVRSSKPKKRKTSHRGGGYEEVLEVSQVGDDCFVGFKNFFGCPYCGDAYTRWMDHKKICKNQCMKEDLGRWGPTTKPTNNCSAEYLERQQIYDSVDEFGLMNRCLCGADLCLSTKLKCNSCSNRYYR